MSPCPSELALEAVLLRAPPAGVAEHVASCTSCRARVADAEVATHLFSTQIYPQTLQPVLEALAPVPWWRRLRVAWVIAAGLTAGLAVLMRPPATPEPTHVGVKGAFGFTAFVEVGEGARAVRDGELISAGAPLRFRVQPLNACHLWIVSADASGAVSRLFPADGDVGAVVHQGPLPGGAVLEGRGPERLFAVCTVQPLGFDALAHAVRRDVAANAASVRSTTALRDLPSGAQQASLLVEKSP